MADENKTIPLLDVPIDTPQMFPEQGFISLVDQSLPQLDESVIKHRAEKFHFGLGEDSPGVERLSEVVGTDAEGPVRQELSLKEMVRNREVKNQLLDQFIAAKGGPQNITQEDVSMFMNLPDEVGADPHTFFEKKYAERVMTSVAPMMEATLLDEAMKENAELANRAIDNGKNMVAHIEYAKQLQEEAESRWNTMDGLRKGINIAETAVPGFTWYNMQNALKEAPTSSLLLGGNLAEQVQFYHLLPLEEAGPLLRQAYNEIFDANPLDAMRFLEAFIKYSSSDVVANNILSILDATAPLSGASIREGITASRTAPRGLAGLGEDVGKATRAAVKGAKIDKSAVDQFKNMMKSAVKATSDRFVTADKVIDAAGDYQLAAFQHVPKALKDRINNVGNIDNFRKIEDEIPTVANPRALLTGTEMGGKELYSRVVSWMEANAENFWKTYFDNPLTIARMEPGSEAHRVAFEEAEKHIRNTYTEVSDAIINVRPINAAETLDRSDRIAVELGTKGATLWQNEAGARMAAEELYGIPKTEYRIGQRGGGFYIEIQRAVDETNPRVRDALAMDIAKNPTPKGFFHGAWLGYLRTPKDTLPKNIADAMDIATYGSTHMAKMMQALGSEIGKFHTENLERFMHTQRAFRDKDGNIGRFSRNLAEFEREYQDMFGKLPTENEMKAYWGYVQMNQADLVTRNYGILRDKNRMGLKSYAFPMKGFKNWQKGWIEGKRIDKLPLGQIEHPFGVLMWEENPSLMRTYYTGNMISAKNLKEKELATLKQPNEMHFIQLTPTGRRALLEKAPPEFKKYLDILKEKGPIDYIAVRDDYDEFDLDFWQLPNRPGGHIDYAYGYFVKQPDVAVHGINIGDRPRSTYYGDRTLMWFNTETAGTKFIDRFNEARKLRAAGKEDELRDYLQKNLPVISYAEFARWFRPVEKGGAGMDVDTPFTLVQKGQSINSKVKLADMRKENGDLMYPNLTEYRDSPHNLYSDGINLQFAAERGDILNTLKGEGTAMKMEQAKILDPLPTINRSLGMLGRNRFLEDLKFKSAEDFITEFKHVLEPDEDTLRRNPVRSLVEGRFRQDVKGLEDRQLLAAARNYRRSVLTFMGVKNEEQKNFYYLKQKIFDSIYKVGGEKGFNAVEPWLIKDLPNPVDKLKNIAFHSKFFLNPATLVQQVQQIWTIAGIEGPINALNGMASGMLMRTLQYSDTPDLLKHVAKLAETYGVKPHHFQESWEALKRTGFHVVGREAAERTDFFDEKIIRSRIGTFFDAGAVFFNEGERLARLTAWNTAYNKWRAENPLKKFGEKEIQQVLSRASMTAGDMNTAAMAAWQKGWLGIPSQFMSYQIRLAEQILGKRLTGAEKRRLLISQAALWGVPVAAAAPIAVWPVHESIRESFLNQGIEPDNNILFKFLNDGFASITLELMAGEKFDTSRLAPGGISVFKDLWDGEDGALDALFGVSTETAGGWLKSTAPLLAWAWGTVTGDDETLPLTAQDWLDFARNASFANNASKMYMALSAGEYVGRNGEVLPLSGFQGTMMAILGLQPDTYADHYAMFSDKKDINTARFEHQQEALKWFRLAWREKDPEIKQTYFKRARMSMPDMLFNPMQKARVFQESTKNFGNIIEKEMWDYSKFDPARRKAFQEKQLNEKAEQQ